jgi:hypothetical protein
MVDIRDFVPNVDTLKQFPSGFMKSFGGIDANTRLRDPNFKPSILPEVPGSLHTLYGLANSGVNYLTGLNLPGGQESAEKSTIINEAVNTKLGIDDPKTTGEMAANFLGSVAMPGPAIVNVPKAIGIPASLLMPTLQSVTKLGKVAEAGTGIVLGDGLVNLLDPEYKSAIFESNTASAAPANPEASVNFTPTEPDVILSDGTNLSAQLRQADADRAQDSFWDRHRSTIIGGATAAAVVAGGAAYRAAVKHRAANLGELMGQAEVPDTFSLSTRAMTAGVDEKTPIFEAVRQTNKSALDDILAAVNTTNSTSTIAGKTKFTAHTGKYSDSTVTGPKLSEILDEVAALDPNEQSILGDGLIARDRKAQMLREGATIWQHVDGRSLNIPDLHVMEQTALANPKIAKLMQQNNEFFASARKYYHEGGMIDGATLRQWDQDYANYIPNQKHFDKDPMWGIVRQINPSGAATFENMAQRLGIKDTQAGTNINPTHLYPDYLANIIDTVQRNKTTKGIIDAVTANPSQRFFSQVPANTAGDDIITVMRNGKTEKWKVKDPFLNRAMHDDPYQAAWILRAARKTKQNLTTGFLAPLQAPVSAAYEVLTAALARPSNMSHGLVGEMLNRTGAPKSIVDVWNKWVLVDPSVAVTPFTGFTRGVAADIARVAGASFQRSVNEGGVLKSILGASNTQHLADVMTDAYARSVKGQMDSMGAGHAPLIEHVSKRTITPDIAAISAKFARQVELGKLTPKQATAYTRMAHGMGKMYSYLASTIPVRAYGSVLENIHDATRIQFVASNLRPGMSNNEIARVMAAAKRLTGDATVVGANRQVKWANQTRPWLPTIIQSNRAIGRAMVEGKGRPMLALASIVGAGVATMYSQFGNPLASQAYWSLTPEQRSQKLAIFYDNDGQELFSIPALQEIMPLWAPIIEAIGSLTGHKTGWDQDTNSSEHGNAILSTADRMSKSLSVGLSNLTGGFFTANDWEDMALGAKAGAGRMMPELMNPVEATAIAATGTDPQSLIPWQRYGTGGKAVKEEQISGEESGKYPDRWITAYTENIMEEVFSAAWKPFTEGVQAAVSDYKLSKDISSALSEMAEGFAFGHADKLKNYGAGQFWEWPGRVDVQDSNKSILDKKLNMVRELETRYTKQRSEGMSTLQPQRGQERIEYYTPPELAGTELGRVMDSTRGITQWYNTMYGSAIREANEALKKLPTNPVYSTNPMQQRLEANRIKSRIREMNAVALEYIHEHEQELGAALGMKDFSFDDLDIAKLKETPRTGP